MSPQVLVALIGALAAVAVATIGYFSHKVTKSLDAVDARLDRVETRIDSIESKIDQLGEALHSRIGDLTETQTHVRERLARVETATQRRIWKPTEARP
ncbi:MAG: hypothetical protein KY429_00430 [Actinobacteria bacterium]|nr:hypothetical protein [Actinomycetota bacterium]